MIPYKSAKHQSGFNVPSKLFSFFKRKQHFLRLGIRGLVVRLQQESKSENSTRLITDWTIKLVQCKVIPNQDEIWHMRRFSSLEFGHFRVSKQSSFTGWGQAGKLNLGRGSLCSTARWHGQLWPQRAEIPPKQWKTEHLQQGFAPILPLKDGIVSSQVSPVLDMVLWM